jgi:hypothetical protein
LTVLCLTGTKSEHLPGSTATTSIRWYNWSPHHFTCQYSRCRSRSIQDSRPSSVPAIFLLIILYTSYLAYDKPRLIPRRTSWSYICAPALMQFLQPGSPSQLTVVKPPRHSGSPPSYWFAFDHRIFLSPHRPPLSFSSFTPPSARSHVLPIRCLLRS